MLSHGKTLVLIASLSLLSSCASERRRDIEHMSAEIARPVRLSDVADGRARFRGIFCELTAAHGPSFPDDRPCDQALVRLADEPDADQRPVSIGAAKIPLHFVFVTGIFGECVSHLGSPFSDAYDHLKTLGYTAQPLVVSGRSSSEANAVLIDQRLNEVLATLGDNVVLVGYSKGIADILVALQKYPLAPWRARVRAIVSVAGAVNGSPLADELGGLYRSIASRVPWPTCPPGDRGGVDSLSRVERIAALVAPTTDERIRYFSVVALPVRNGVNPLLAPFYNELSSIDPRNDGQVLAYDAILPRSTLLAYADADHWAIALPFNRSDHPSAKLLAGNNAYPREILIESVARFIEEALVSR
jgi:hypothetical protein